MIDIDFNRMPKNSQSKKYKILAFVSQSFFKGFNLPKVDYNTGMIRVEKVGCSINLYSTTLTITTEINHPKKGKTQLHRKGVDFEGLIKLLDNPRLHTGKGYYKKR